MSNDLAANPASVLPDNWTALRDLTPARLALGRAGAALPTEAMLAFGLAHAQARDAVHAALDVAALQAALAREGWPTLTVQSAAPDRAAYLARPDWGRQLAEHSRAALVPGGADLVFVVSDGLSSLAAQLQAAPLLAALRPKLSGWRIAPVVIATQARVALADAVGEALGARMAVSLIGERPGLSAADSLGAYLTYAPRRGTSDAARNCVSNIRPQGLGFEVAATQIAALIEAAFAQQKSGVGLRLSALLPAQNSLPSS